MRVSGKILDDLMRKLLPKLLASTNYVESSRGRSRELSGVLLELEQPRGRLSRTETRGKPFSCLGELLWYLSRDNKLDFIRYYIPRYVKESEDGATVRGGYGPRIFSQRTHDQLRDVIRLLTEQPDSRRAVIQIFAAGDISEKYKEAPCTCTFQFLMRRKRLHMMTTMRSNDAYTGLPHDVFCFTMLHEIVASTLGVELGAYKHFVGSLHVYDEHLELVKQYLDEAVQATVLMPPMPKGDPWLSIRKLLDAEYRIRNRLVLESSLWQVDPYWQDLIRLLQIFAATGDKAAIDAIKAQMAFEKYAPYIETRKGMAPRDVQQPQQPLLL